MDNIFSINSETLNIILICLFSFLLFILLTFCILVLIKYKKWTKILNLKNKKINLNKDFYIDEKEKLDKLIIDNEKLNLKLENEIENYIYKSSSILGLSKEDLKKEMENEIEKFYKKDLAKEINEWKNKNFEEVKILASNILVDSMEQIVEDVIKNTSVNIKIDENMKGRIIGKEGRIIKAFSEITGVDLSIDSNSPNALLSSFNPLRKEIGARTLKKLLTQRSIDIEKIEQIYNKEVELINDEITTIGKKIIQDDLKIDEFVSKELYYYVGKLNFRFSLSQSVLTHSLECATLASSIAIELGLDKNKAIMSAFFHDIGKSIDYEENNDHVESGIKLARKYNLPNYVINAIESHHDNVPPDNIYSCITKVADIVSASRPGIRQSNSNELFNRLQSIEKVCLEFEGVKQAFVIKAGKKVRVIIDPNIIDDDSIVILGKKIQEKFNNDPSISTKPVDIMLIRENIFEIKSKTKKI